MLLVYCKDIHEILSFFCCVKLISAHVKIKMSSRVKITLTDKLISCFDPFKFFVHFFVYDIKISI